MVGRTPALSAALAVGALALACSLAALPAWSQGLPINAVDLEPLVPAAPAGDGNDADLRLDWRDYALELRDRLRDAEARFNAAERAYIKGRHRRRMRGEDRALIVAERDQARRDLERARASFRDLPDQARRAGVPPGWIRDALE